MENLVKRVKNLGHNKETLSKSNEYDNLNSTTVLGHEKEASDACYN